MFEEKPLSSAERYWIKDINDKLLDAQRHLQKCLLCILEERGEDTTLYWEFIKDNNGNLVGYKRGSKSAESNDTNEGDASTGDN